MPNTNVSELKTPEMQPLAGKVTTAKVVAGKGSAGKGVAEKAKTILIVEDNAVLRETLCDLLQTTHPEWCVVEAQNGLEGLKLAQRIYPDVILLDFNMPIMNGYELALMLQSQPDTSQIPLILNSAEDADHPLIMRLHTMCQAILSKPFSLREIERIVTSILLPAVPTHAAVPYVTGSYGEWGGTWQAALS